MCLKVYFGHRIMQRQTKLEDWAYSSMEGPSDDPFGSLEELLRFYLKDSQARFTQSPSRGRVTLEMQEEALILLFGLCQQMKEEKWSREKKFMEKMTCGLRAQLDRAQAVHAHSAQESMHLKVQVQRLSEALFEIQSNFEQQTSGCLDLKVKLAQAEMLQENLNKMEVELLKQKEEAKRAMEQSQASHQARLQEQRAETSRLEYALREAEEVLATERCRLQRERASLLEEMEKSRAPYMAQLEEQIQENNVVMDALKMVEQGLESNRVRWQKEKSSLLQAIDGLQKTLQQKQQEWEEIDSCMRPQVAELESQMQKKKWYRKFF